MWKQMMDLLKPVPSYVVIDLSIVRGWLIIQIRLRGIRGIRRRTGTAGGGRYDHFRNYPAMSICQLADLQLEDMTLSDCAIKVDPQLYNRFGSCHCGRNTDESGHLMAPQARKAGFNFLFPQSGWVQTI